MMDRINSIYAYLRLMISCFLLITLTKDKLQAQPNKGSLTPNCQSLAADSSFALGMLTYNYQVLQANPELLNAEEYDSCIAEKNQIIFEKFGDEMSGRSIYRIRIDTAGKVDFVCHYRIIHPQVNQDYLPCIKAMRFPRLEDEEIPINYWLNIVIRYEGMK